jgi:acyl-CoA ligase (AMP-forming) (exosortase A-associated)
LPLAIIRPTIEEFTSNYAILALLHHQLRLRFINSMPELLHQAIALHAQRNPDSTALIFKDMHINYAGLQSHICAAASGFLGLGVEAGERIAVYLPKTPETVYTIFAASAAGCSFVPINPLLKARQVGYILRDCNVRILVTSNQRLHQLSDILADCPDLQTVVTIDPEPSKPSPTINLLTWSQLGSAKNPPQAHTRIDADMVAILYTSGSTGSPKGVILSHRNMVCGANSVAQYLCNTENDRLLAVLPLSFDAGLSQLTTAFSVGASVVLMDYLLPRDVIRAISRYNVTGLAAVPPLWNQLVTLDWPEEAVASVRYITNTGGAMPKATTTSLQEILPDADIYLMYGLTEAFRSTYLPPDQVEKRPDSIGKAIPNAEILVINARGELCASGEPGELVHRGALVAMGYWNDPAKTAERFRPVPNQWAQLPITELAVWSGDQVKADDEGFLYFINRKDEMIKTSGYRVSPTEVEEIVYESGLINDAVAIGLPHPTVGQAIFLAVTNVKSQLEDHVLKERLLSYCRQEMPGFMVPQTIVVLDRLPQNQNGKIDRNALSTEYYNNFEDLEA